MVNQPIGIHGPGIFRCGRITSIAKLKSSYNSFKGPQWQSGNTLTSHL